MKNKPEPKKTEAVVTSTARLTIQGTTFDMPLAELEDLYVKIGAALGKDKPDLRDIYRKISERPAQWEQPAIPHYIQHPIIDPPSKPSWFPPDVICRDGTGSSPQNWLSLICEVQDRNPKAFDLS